MIQANRALNQFTVIIILVDQILYENNNKLIINLDKIANFTDYPRR